MLLNVCHMKPVIPVLPLCSLSSFPPLLLRNDHPPPPPLDRRLCFIFGLAPPAGLTAPGNCLDGKPIPGLSVLIELARLMLSLLRLSGLSLLSKPLKVSALLGPIPGTNKDEELPWVSLWASSDEGSSLDNVDCTCCIVVIRHSLKTKWDHHARRKS